MQISAQKKRGLTARKSSKKGGPAAPRMKARGGYRRPRKIFERNCSVGRTVSILCNSWSFLILRECLFGARRFQTFQSILGLPRQTLAIRLKELTRQGLLRRVQYLLPPRR